MGRISRLERKKDETPSWICLEQVWTSVKFGDRSLFLCALYIAPDRIRDRELIETHCQSVWEATKAKDKVIIYARDLVEKIKQWFLLSRYRPFRHSFQRYFLFLDNHSSVTLSQINHVTNHNNRRLDLITIR